MQFKLKVMLILIFVMTAPILMIGVGSALYYQDVVKRSIWDDNMAQAKAVSLHTPTYMDSASLYLESLADRPLVIKAMDEKNVTFLNETTRYAGITFKSIDNSTIFDEIFITDPSGTVVSSYPHRDVIGKNVFNKTYVNQSILLDKTTVSDGVLSDETGEPTVYVVVPIDNSTANYTSMESHNSTVYGTLVGEINLHDYAKTIFGTQVKNNQYIYMVNRTGHIMVHNDHTYMSTMKDYSAVPAVQNVLKGEEDVAEQYNPVEHDWRLAAYSPIPKYGWGAVVALPVEVAHLLKEAFSNIINNAIKYSGPDVHIDIDQKETVLGGKKYYEVSISDNGPGIPDELKRKLFRRFQRGNTGAHGKGLGLYITKMLVERFGGKVCVEDRVPGDYKKGSKFVILLPAA